MYKVFDNGICADINGSCACMPKGLGWDNSEFKTKHEAYEYADKYLNTFSPFINGYGDYTLLDNPYTYTNSGDKILVKKIK